MKFSRKNTTLNPAGGIQAKRPNMEYYMSLTIRNAKKHVEGHI